MIIYIIKRGRKKMKRKTTLVFGILLSLSVSILVGCGSQSSSDDTNDSVIISAGDDGVDLSQDKQSSTSDDLVIEEPEEEEETPETEIIDDELTMTPNTLLGDWSSDDDELYEFNNGLYSKYNTTTGDYEEGYYETDDESSLTIYYKRTTTKEIEDNTDTSTTTSDTSTTSDGSTTSDNSEVASDVDENGVALEQTTEEEAKEAKKKLKEDKKKAKESQKEEKEKAEELGEDTSVETVTSYEEKNYTIEFSTDKDEYDNTISKVVIKNSKNKVVATLTKLFDIEKSDTTYTVPTEDEETES
jgi:hypothetical protein